jgi:hypothetical protein
MIYGAPEEIRTPDPQIRRLAADVDIQAENCKPRSKRPKRSQRVRASSANRKKPSEVDPPGPRKRSPASPASENGANRELKCSKRQSTATRPNAQEPERHFYWVTHGQTNIGFVEQVDKTYKAISADDRDLGTFDCLKAAADAVSASFGGAA